jgi:UDP-N-acetylglucosamine acyltransferase
VIGAECLLCAGAHVGHNTSLGDRVELGDNVLLAGHTEIGTCVRMGSGAGVHQFTRIGEWARVESNVTIRQDIVPCACVSDDDHITGINEIALDAFTEEETADLRALLQLFLSGHRSFRELCRRMENAARTATGLRFVEFVCADSRRGFAGGKATAPCRSAELR